MNRPEHLDVLSATAVTDFYRPLFAPHKSDQHYLKVSRVMTAIWGGVQIVVAMIAIAMQGRGVDAVLAVASFTNGPVLGLFLLSTLTRHVGAKGALMGVVVGGRLHDVRLGATAHFLAVVRLDRFAGHVCRRVSSGVIVGRD